MNISLKRIVFVTISVMAILIMMPTSTFAASRVRGYVKSNGTYVQPYFRSTPNYTRFDNYSTRGNYNPYTGSKGYTIPYKTYRIR